MQNWIKCSERMPEKDVAVLCFPMGDEVTHASWDGKYWHQDNSWCGVCYIDDVITVEVTHWQPLPEPPQE